VSLFKIGTRVIVTSEQHPWHTYSGAILVAIGPRAWIVELDNGMRPTVREHEMRPA
jgi:hypothetical protein